MAKKASNKKNEPVVETVNENLQEEIINETEQQVVNPVKKEVQKVIENKTEEVKEEINNIKTEQTDFLNSLDITQQEETKKVLTQELNKVNASIKEINGKINDLSKNFKNNKTFITSTSWNGWGYDQ